MNLENEVSANGIFWEMDNWALGCKFDTNGLVHLNVSSISDCSTKCTILDGCSHYNIVHYSGPSMNGTQPLLCSLHLGEVDKSTAIKVTPDRKYGCGLTSSSYTLGKNNLNHLS